MHVSPTAPGGVGFNVGKYIKPNGDLKPMVYIVSEEMPTMQILPEEVNITTDAMVAPTIQIKLGKHEINRLLGGGAEMVQFARDQISNYDEDLSADFVAGYKAALEVLLGHKVLEEYL